MTASLIVGYIWVLAGVATAIFAFMSMFRYPLRDLISKTLGQEVGLPPELQTSEKDAQ